jgi:KaiC/GvpD/RAD55 family RecA-like ATPase
MTKDIRLQTGITALDDLLGGGLLPGTMTVVMGATGIGKTQLGLQFAQQGMHQEGARGILFDMTTRGDSQHHREYARRLFDWELHERPADAKFDPDRLWQPESARCDYVHIFRRTGRRVTIGDLEADQWREWKIELGKKLDQAIAFFYGNFIHGVRRCVIDGVEPTDRASDSFQFHMFDYIYHQILHKDADWVARDLFRVQFRANEEAVRRHMYDHNQIGCLLLYTTHEVMLDHLLSRPIESGDVLSNANTVILMGKIREGTRMGRALHIAKHRGSACDDRIVPFEITDRGLQLLA